MSTHCISAPGFGRVAAVMLLALGTAAALAQPGIRINEVSITPDGGPQWVELYNAAITPKPLANYIVTDRDIGLHPIPAGMPLVPPGAFVMVVFDGAGAAADDYDFSDNVAEVHSEAFVIDPLDPLGDVVALYDDSGAFSADAIVSFVAWGAAPGSDASDAVGAGLWPGEEVVINVQTVEPIEGPLAQLEPGGTFGVYSDGPLAALEDWVHYTAAQATYASPNLPPAPVLYLPGAGVHSEDPTPTFSWTAVSGAVNYHLQLDDDPAFGSPLIDDATLTDASYTPAAGIAEATYYWRVRVLGNIAMPGPWSEMRELVIGWGPLPPAPPPTPTRDEDPSRATVSGTVKDDYSGRGLGGVTITINPGGHTTVTAADGSWSIPGVPDGDYIVTAARDGYEDDTQDITVSGDTTGVDFRQVGETNVLGVPSLAARKDGNLLCIDGCNEYPHELNRGENNHHWDGSHTPRSKWGTHERMYCTPTAAAMLARYRGGDVHIEEISYDIWKGGGPEIDLGHNRGHNLARQAQSLRFALQCGDAQLHYTAVQPTDQQLIDYIDADRPIRYSSGAHAMVVSGYKWINGRLAARFLNTDNNGHAGWYYWRGAHAQPFSHCWIPDAGLSGRDKDPRVETDSDGDGVMDFDEDERFQCTKTDPDTDKDQVDDKNDIKNYTFHRNYCSRHRGVLPPALYDIDGDGLRAENDCDADSPRAAGGDGDFDGGEDTDGDGHNPDYSETCMYDPADFKIAVSVDQDVYWVGQPVYIVDTPARPTRSYHFFSTYNYELAQGCPDKSDGDTVGHDGSFTTNVWGYAQKKLVHYCPAPGDWYLNVDVLDDGMYMEPDNWDPLTCWLCIALATPPTSYPSPPAQSPPTGPCSTPAPVPLQGSGSTGPIQTYEWKTDRYPLVITESPDTQQYLPAGYHNITLTVHSYQEGYWFSDSASFGYQVDREFPVELPVFIPMGQQLNYHPMGDPFFDAITAPESSPPPQFMNDGTDHFTRMNIYEPRFEGPYIDLGLACFGPLDLSAPGTMLGLTARYHQDELGNAAPYWDAPINVRLRDEHGLTAEFGPIYGPLVEMPYPTWQTVSVPMDAAVAADGFDWSHVIRIEFHGEDWFMEGTGDFIDILEVFIEPGGFAKGDMNCDGNVDFSDINPFVIALVEGEAGYYAAYPTCDYYNADMSLDGAVSFDDINPFVECLVSGICP